MVRHERNTAAIAARHRRGSTESPEPSPLARDDPAQARRRVRILAAESLGVRGLAVCIETAGRTILIDPSFSLVPRRFRRPPHAIEVAAAWRARQRLDHARRRAGTIVLSHYHYDHLIPPEHRPFEFCTPELRRRFYSGVRLLVRSAAGKINPAQQRRARELFEAFEHVEQVDGRCLEDIEFSGPIPHGARGSKQGYVIACRIACEGLRIGYGSDSQCLTDELLEWFARRPVDVLIVSGPPLYHPQVPDPIKREGLARLERLAACVPQLVVDHHVARSPDFERILERLSQACGRRVFCAASWNGQPIRLLEATRKQLHDRWPVGAGWYRAVEQGEQDVLDHVRRMAQRLDDPRFDPMEHTP